MQNQMNKYVNICLEMYNSHDFTNNLVFITI